MSHSQPKKAAQPATADALPQKLKTQIIDFKDIFPRYRACTNDDILAIFDEFNNDYEAAVYGAVNGLVVYQPGDAWRPVDKTKKKKRGQNSRGTQSQRGSRTDTDSRHNRRDRDSRDSRDRGQTSSRGRGSSSSRGGAAAGSSRQDRHSQPAAVAAPPPVRSKDSSAEVKPTRLASTTKQSDPASAAKSEPQKTSASTAPPAWGPRGAAAAAARTPAKAAPSSSHSQAQGRPAKAQAAGPASSYANIAKTRQPWNPSAGSKAAAPNAAQAPAATRAQAQPPVQKRVEPTPQKMQPRAPKAAEPAAPPKAETKPRVGVLLPGNFATEDMTFQFGNLGLPFGDANISGSTHVLDDLKPTTSLMAEAPAGSSLSQSTQGADSLAAKKEDAPEASSTPQQAAFPQPGYPGAEGEIGMRPPHMQNMYYGDSTRGEQAKRGPAAQGYTPGGRGDSTKLPEGAGGPQGVAQAYPPGYGYPMYGGFPNQYPGGQYGNQFYNSFRHNYYQGGFGMPYGHEEEYKARGMNPYGYPPQDGPSSPTHDGRPQGQEDKQAKDGAPDGFESGYGRGNEQYYTQQDVYNFGQGYYPPMMGGHYPQPPQQGGQAQQPQGPRGY